jgi:hypothetical protein
MHSHSVDAACISRFDCEISATTLLKKKRKSAKAQKRKSAKAQKRKSAKAQKRIKSEHDE